MAGSSRLMNIWNLQGIFQLFALNFTLPQSQISGIGFSMQPTQNDCNTKSQTEL